MCCSAREMRRPHCFASSSNALPPDAAPRLRAACTPAARAAVACRACVRLRPSPPARCRDEHSSIRTQRHRTLPVASAPRACVRASGRACPNGGSRQSWPLAARRSAPIVLTCPHPSHSGDPQLARVAARMSRDPSPQKASSRLSRLPVLNRRPPMRNTTACDRTAAPTRPALCRAAYTRRGNDPAHGSRAATGTWRPPFIHANRPGTNRATSSPIERLIMTVTATLTT